MSKIAKDFGIEEALMALGIQENNNGTSTGSKNFGSGEILESHSPVDGALIAKVKTTSTEDYERAVSSATEAFKDLAEKTRPETWGNRPSVW